MTEQNKKIVGVEILHLDEPGYGPEGKHTRREWREECLKNLLAGKAQFEKWQRGCKKNQHTDECRYDIKETYSDSTSNVIAIFASQVSIDLTAVVFDKPVCFDGYEFTLEVFLNKSQFQSYASFSKTVIYTGRFDSSSFNYADFNEAIFGSVYFVDTVFKRANFRNAKFEAAWFNSSHFISDTTFFDCQFITDAYFSNILISGKANFSECKFERAAVFQKSIFLDDFIFTRTNVKNTCVFQKVSFHKAANFENVTLENVGHFEGATFNSKNSKIPAFRGSKIGDTRLEFSDDAYFTQDDFTEDAIKNISFLKRLADEHGQTDQALNFNAMELRAKRKSAWQQFLPERHTDAKFLSGHNSWRLFIYFSNFFRETFWFCVFTWAYEKFSDFGRSFVRPLSFLIFLLIFSFLFCATSSFLNSPANLSGTRQPIFSELQRVYIFSEEKENKLHSLSGYRAAFEYSLYRSGNFLDFTDADKNTASINMRLFGSEIEPLWARIFGFIKGIATAMLLFLIALGLRNKYRVS